MTEEIKRRVRSGELTPDQALAEFDKNPARRLTDIPISGLRVSTLDCGFQSLNDCDVFASGEGSLVIVEARPGMGKSAMIFQIAFHVAETAPVLLFSQEMSLRAIMQRAVAGRTGLGLKRVKHGVGTQDAYQQAYAELDKLNIEVVDTSVDIGALRSIALQKAKQQKPALIVVDYLQIVPGNTRMDRHKEIGDVAKALRDLGVQLQCPVLTAAQVNRACLQRGFEMLRNGDEPDFMPAQGELSESDKADFHADVILGLCREEVITGKRQGLADVQILKNRSGELGRFTFKFLGASTRFVDPKQASQGEELV